MVVEQWLKVRIWPRCFWSENASRIAVDFYLDVAMVNERRRRRLKVWKKKPADFRLASSLNSFRASADTSKETRDTVKQQKQRKRVKYQSAMS